MITTVINKRAIYSDKCNNWIKEIYLELPDSSEDRRDLALLIFFNWIKKIDCVEKVDYLRYDLLSLGSFLYSNDANKVSDIICKSIVDIKGVCVNGIVMNFEDKESMVLKMYFGLEESTMEKMDYFNRFIKIIIEVLTAILCMNDTELNLCRSLINSMELKYICRNIVNDLSGGIKKDD